MAAGCRMDERAGRCSFCRPADVTTRCTLSSSSLLTSSVFPCAPYDRPIGGHTLATSPPCSVAAHPVLRSLGAIVRRHVQVCSSLKSLKGHLNQVSGHILPRPSHSQWPRVKLSIQAFMYVAPPFQPAAAYSTPRVQACRKKSLPSKPVVAYSIELSEL